MANLWCVTNDNALTYTFMDSIVFGKLMFALSQPRVNAFKKCDIKLNLRNYTDLINFKLLSYSLLLFKV